MHNTVHYYPLITRLVLLLPGYFHLEFDQRRICRPGLLFPVHVGVDEDGGDGGRLGQGGAGGLQLTDQNAVML